LRLLVIAEPSPSAWPVAREAEVVSNILAKLQVRTRVETTAVLDLELLVVQVAVAFGVTSKLDIGPAPDDIEDRLLTHCGAPFRLGGVGMRACGSRFAELSDGPDPRTAQFVCAWSPLHLAIEGLARARLGMDRERVLNGFHLIHPDVE
jgi:hypothetical protein